MRPCGILYLAPLKLSKRISGQQRDSVLASFLAKVGEDREEVNGREEFVVHQWVLCRRRIEDDGGELLHVVLLWQ